MKVIFPTILVTLVWRVRYLCLLNAGFCELVSQKQKNSALGGKEHRMSQLNVTRIVGLENN